MTRTLSFCGVMLALLIFLILTASHYRDKYLETTQALVTVQAVNLSQAKTIVAMKQADAVNRELTVKQLNQEQTLRKKANDENQKLRKALGDDDCNNRHLPDAVIDILRQRSSSDTNHLPVTTRSTAHPL